MRLGGLLLAFLLLPGLPAGAEIEPYGGDPLELVAFAEHGRVYAAGVDVWEVFVCRMSNGSVAITPQQVVNSLSATITPYFDWLSQGAYVPRFRVGGAFDVPFPSLWPEVPNAQQLECEQGAYTATSGEAAGALIVVDVPFEGGYATAGASCEVISECPTNFPENGRIAVVGATAVTPVGQMTMPRLRTVAHEIGHGLSWPHSFGGLTTFLGGLVYEYDNPMDLMSGGEQDALDVGTLAVNRYAAGWLDPQSARFHRAGTADYVLSPTGTTGPQFLVLPTDERGVYDVIAPRIRKGFDTGIPVEGVEVYHIDQRPSLCGFPADTACWGVHRRTQPQPPVDDPEGVSHVHEVGEFFAVRGATVEVIGRDTDRITLRVTGSVVSQRFVDDDGNFHEAAISTIADAGITRGCNPPRNDHYCPGRAVTRAEMAAFLIRVLGLEGQAPLFQGLFTDVEPEAWYAGVVEHLSLLGIVTGYEDGAYRPDQPVSRAEMAALLTRTFGTITPVPEPSGVFTDVPVDAWFAPSVEGLLASQITTGCDSDPLSFCPTDVVLRDQMGSFLARALRSG